MESNELIKLIEVAPERDKEAIITFFKLCQKYASVYKFYKNTEQSRKVLQNYLDDEQRLIKKDQGERIKPENLDIPTKLLVYYFWLAYKKHFKAENDKNFIKLINGNDVDKISKIWDEIFENDNNFSKRYKKATIDQALLYIFDHFSNDIRSIDNLHYENLFKAMASLEIENENPLPDLIESFKMVISQEYVEKLIELLESGNYAIFTITVAPIARALTTDNESINSYIPNNENKTVYFADKFRLNLIKLDNYMESFKELYEEYKETNDELLADYEAYI